MNSNYHLDIAYIAGLKYIYKFLHFIMEWTGQINSWAWRKHARILRDEQKIDSDKLIRDQENSAYLEELKRKL
jgi:hypothetical protein